MSPISAAVPAALTLAALLAACAPGPGDMAAEPDLETLGVIDQGRMIAAQNCATCHAIGEAGPSPRADAPPLRTVLAVNDAENLETDLIEGLHLGHEDMPRFSFSPREADMLMTWLETIQE